jgi:general secretion pathway protein I
MRAPIARNRQRGFSLIEMVAAFLVFALAIGILMQILASSMHTTRTSSDYTMAALWAESMLDVVGVGEPIQPGSSSGRFDNTYSWDLNIQLVDPTTIEPPPQYTMAAPNGMPQQGMQQQGMQQRITTTAGNPGGIQMNEFDLYQIDLTVYWGGGFGSPQHSARFGTLRTMNPDPTTQQGQPGQQQGGTLNSSSGSIGR